MTMNDDERLGCGCLIIIAALLVGIPFLLGVAIIILRLLARAVGL
jgi:hypothetical protein